MWQALRLLAASALGSEAARAGWCLGAGDIGAKVPWVLGFACAAYVAVVTEMGFKHDDEEDGR